MPSGIETSPPYGRRLWYEITKIAPRALFPRPFACRARVELLQDVLFEAVTVDFAGVSNTDCVCLSTIS
ncbi:hypothetical protein ALC62_01325 [Cyphomyrmex costatus]|uniref:Uncharacterized protein n=1 Tax=Cyphomyrmex costatus TaxID=456900 RepID=A0A195D5V6_9HYME|nr:hypothetical protein ALC62_01325 [Cyphomyrmex costatus]